MKIPRHLKDSAAISAGARVYHANQPRGKIEAKNLRKRHDGTLEFWNGTPVRAGELIPGETYTVHLTGEKK